MNMKLWLLFYSRSNRYFPSNIFLFVLTLFFSLQLRLYEFWIIIFPLFSSSFDFYFELFHLFQCDRLNGLDSWFLFGVVEEWKLVNDSVLWTMKIIYHFDFFPLVFFVVWLFPTHFNGNDELFELAWQKENLSWRKLKIVHGFCSKLSFDCKLNWGRDLIFDHLKFTKQTHHNPPDSCMLFPTSLSI